MDSKICTFFTGKYYEFLRFGLVGFSVWSLLCKCQLYFMRSYTTNMGSIGHPIELGFVKDNRTQVVYIHFTK